jgi:hypothetical protein
MFARFLAATFCCIGCLAATDSPGPSEGALVVYTTGAPAASTFRSETESMMQAAGYTVEWRDASTNRDLDAPSLVVLQFAGDCSAPSAPIPSTESVAGRSLASATVQQGTVLPFARVDCAALRGALAPILAREAPARRQYLYGRAIGRLIAHELYHVLAGARDHAANGVAKPCFTPGDLVADRFEFDSVALARLRRPVADTVDTGFDGAGRQ